MSNQTVSAKERISKSKWRFLLRHPFLGELAMRLMTKQEKLPNGSSMATDGKHLIYDEENIDKIEHDFKKGHDPDVEDIIAHEIGHCLRGDTPILTDKGLKPISEIKVGDKVYGKGWFTKVTEVMKRHYEGKIVKITPRYGDTIYVTPEHPVLGLRYDHKNYLGMPRSIESSKGTSSVRFIPAGKLTTKDCVALHLPKFDYRHVKTVGRTRQSYVVNKVTFDEDIAYFCGFFIADGNLSKSGGKGEWFGDTKTKRNICITLHENDDETRLINVIQNKIKRSPCIMKVKGAKAKRIVFSGKMIANFLLKNFYDEKGGKTIPSWLLGMPNNIIENFVDGYVEGDGHITKAGQVKTTSIFPGIQGMLPLLLLKIGHFPSIHYKENKGGFPNGKPFREISWQASRKLNYSTVLGNNWIVPIKSIEYEDYCGDVYNFETTSHVYTVPLFTVHNCVYRHVGKQGIQRQHTKVLPVWIVACEYAVNHFVVDLCVPFIGREGNKSVLNSIDPKTGKPKYFYDKKYADGNWTTEDIYWDLMQSDKVKFCTIDADGNVFDKDGNKIGKVSDDHSKWGEGAEGKDGEAQDQDWKIWVVQAAQNAKRQGKLPGDLEKLIEDLADSKIPWQHELAEFVLNRSKDDYSWRRLNKRHLHRGIFAPSLHSETINIAYIVDTSGSMYDTETLRRGFSEIKAICSAFPSYRLHLIAADAAVHSYQEVSPCDEIDFKSLSKGGGGTNFHALNYFEENGIDIDAAIYFTDLYGDFPDPPDFTTVWLTMTPNVEPPFGRKILYEE